MESIINLEGWQLFWTCAGLGIIGGGFMVGLMALAGWVDGFGEEWRERE